ncbi:MAG TPA: hypothetical protein ENK35_09145 [Candidatus Tenderia sp.]|nr:hypothetical protein [Candidatus Tenderia sp.]
MADRVAYSKSVAGNGDVFVPDALRQHERGRGLSQSRLMAMLGYIAAAYVVFMGWINRDGVFFGSVTAPHYVLGVLGGALMLALLYYPVWKVIGGGRWKNALKWWFRAHVVFGVLAPASILYHANFQLSSAESQVSVALMVLVALSGLLGRLIYSKTHSGISGDETTVESLGRDKAYAKYKLATVCGFAPRFRNGLQAYEIAALSPASSFFDALCRLSSFGIWTTWHEAVYRRQLSEALEYEAHRMKWSDMQLRSVRSDANKYLNLYLSSVRKMGGLSFYGNLFSLWHALHLPLLMMMVAAGMLHVLGL